MSFTRKIAWNTAVQFGAKLAGLAVGLVTIGFLTRYLGVEGYGEYTTIIAFVEDPDGYAIELIGKKG